MALRTVFRLLGLPCALALLAGPAESFQVHSNDLPLNNVGDVFYIYSSPSVGSSVGTVPPDLAGDLYWRALPGDRVMSHETAFGAVMEVDGYYETLWDTYWGTTASPSPADFYDRSHGLALASTVNPGVLEPAFFQQGWTTEVLVSIGNSGFGNPCTVAPSLCTPPGGPCPPIGFVNGYLVDLQFSSTPGTGVVLPADGTSASDTALTYFLAGGMTATGGVCGMGDYVLQDVHSTDETQADATGSGVNPFGGFQLAGSGPLAEAVTSMAEGHETYRDPLLNVVADSGLGVEVGDNGGGALNGLNLSVGGGTATLGVELRSLGSAVTPNVAVVAASLSPLSPSASVFGAALKIKPDALFLTTSSVWQGSVSATTFVFTSEAVFSGAQLPVPPVAAGATLYLQGFALDLTTFTGSNTNRVATRLFP